MYTALLTGVNYTILHSLPNITYCYHTNLATFCPLYSVNTHHSHSIS